MQSSDGRSLTLHPRTIDARRLDVFDQAAGPLQVNDRVRWNRNDRDLKLSRGDLGSVTAIAGTRATIAFDKGQTREIDVATPAHQHDDYGYVVTAYAVQGMTRNWVAARRVVAHQPGQLAQHVCRPVPRREQRHDRHQRYRQASAGHRNPRRRKDHRP